MKSVSSSTLLAALALCLMADLMSGALGQVVVGKSVVNYLGTTYLMRDGCPPPQCDLTSEECTKVHNTIRALYSSCIQSEEGQHLGCVTDRLQDGSFLTVPIYATMCSARCYEKTPEDLKSIHRCPYKGTREHRTDLSRLF